MPEALGDGIPKDGIPADDNRATESASLDALCEAHQRMRNRPSSKTLVREYHRALLNAVKVWTLKEMDREKFPKPKE